MDKFHKEVLNLLTEDARYTLDNLAVMLGSDLEKVEKAVEKLENDGVIVKYSAIVDRENIDDETVEALIEVRVTPQKNHGFDAIAEDIYKLKQVKSLYLMSGGYDLAVFVEGKTLKEVARFVAERLSTLDSVLSTATHFILKKYKIEGAVTKGGGEVSRLAIHP